MIEEFKKIQHPIKNFDWQKNISQLFGVNKRIYEPNFGIPGHNGFDYVVRNDKLGYGEPILAAHDGIVEELKYETEWRTKGSGIYLLSEDGSFYTIYWHLSEIQVVIGQKVKTGEVIGQTSTSPGWILLNSDSFITMRAGPV